MGTAAALLRGGYHGAIRGLLINHIHSHSAAHVLDMDITLCDIPNLYRLSPGACFNHHFDT